MMKLKYYKNLDGVRACAALMVMIFHFFQATKHDTKLVALLAKISLFGQTGVTLFFVLSGFLITRILLHTKHEQFYFKNFYLRRALRIFPLYYSFLVISYFFLPFVFDTKVPTFGQQLYYYTYLQNFAITFKWSAVGPGHFWSLAVEEHFYLFWPVIVFFVGRKKLLNTIFAILLFALLMRMYMLNKGYPVFYFTFTRFDSLAVGALLALLEMKNLYTAKNSYRFLLLLGSIFIPTVLTWVFVSGNESYYIQVIKYLLLAFTYFALIAYLLSLRESNLLNRILRSNFFAYTGKISYGLYVYHPFSFSLQEKFFDSGYLLINLLVSFCLTYILSAISYEYFESVFLRMKKHFSSEKKVLSKLPVVNEQ